MIKADLYNDLSSTPTLSFLRASGRRAHSHPLPGTSLSETGKPHAHPWSSPWQFGGLRFRQAGRP
jgi:hypothetical protein